MVSNNYGINDIQSLDFREGVRTRINMYLGSNDLEGTYQALKEIINNSTDEALAGFGNKIEITVNETKNKISVRDYGRGVPFGIRDDGENVLISIYTKSHTGGKFTDDVYKNASGLNGVGGSCVCLSSKSFTAVSYRDGTQAIAKFKEGINSSYEEKPTKEANGTYVEFTPDPKVFSNGEIGYSFERICQDIKDISYLYKNITFKVKNAETKESKSFSAKNGIIDFVKDNLKTSVHPNIIYHSVQDDSGDTLEIAFQWGSAYEQSYVFVNGLRCPEGGTPITGAKTAFTKVFNSLLGTNFEGTAIRNNLFYVINCSVAHPSFANQTKTKINNSNLRQLASGCVSEGLKQMNTFYPNDMNTVLSLISKVARAEVAAEKARKQILETTNTIEKNQKKRVINSTKLKDAENLGEDSILLICEGDSAMSGMTQARDYQKYGLMGIKGKIINALSNTDEDIFANEEVKLLLSAMNIVPGKYDSKKLRYGRIGICSDADSDGQVMANERLFA